MPDYQQRVTLTEQDVVTANIGVAYLMREFPMAVRQTYLPRYLMVFSPLPKGARWMPQSLRQIFWGQVFWGQVLHLNIFLVLFQIWR